MKPGFDATYRTAFGLSTQFEVNDTLCQPLLSVAGHTPPAKKDGDDKKDDKKDDERDEDENDE